MKKRIVIFNPSAQIDLVLIEEWIAENAGVAIANGYGRRILTFCNRLEIGSERGTRRDDIKAGMRVIGFEKRVTILFNVSPNAVTILRILYGGRNWDSGFDAEP